MEFSNTIGSKLRQIRDERGLTRQGLADRTRHADPAAKGVSVEMIRKIEQGERQPGMGTIYALAAALGAEPARLLDKRPLLKAGDEEDSALLALRDALTDPAGLPGLALDEEGTPATLETLQDAVGTAWDAYWEGRFGLLASLLGVVVRSGRASGETLGQDAQRPLAQALQLSADLFAHMGDDNFAMLVARRAYCAAEDSGDELQAAAVAGTLSWIMQHQGRLDRAEQLAAAAADRIRPRQKVSLDHWNVYGALILSAAAPAATAGKADTVEGYMLDARAAAVHFTEGDGHAYQCSFGPTQVAMQICYTSTTLGRFGPALAAAKRVDRADLLRISYGAHQLDVAQSCLGRRKTAAGIDALWEAYQVSEEWFRQQPNAKAATEKAFRSGDSRMRRLAAATGLRTRI